MDEDYITRLTAVSTCP